MLNNQSLESSLNDFKEYKKDLKKIAKYVHNVGGDLKLEHFEAKVIRESLNYADWFVFTLTQRTKTLFRNENIIFFYFNYDDEGEPFFYRIVKGITYEIQNEFIEFIKELDTDIQVRSGLRNEYRDSMQAFHELMENKNGN